MEASNKSPVTLDENKKFAHCVNIYTLLEMQKKTIPYYPDESLLIQTYAKLFDTYYTHCEYKSGSQK